MDGRLVWLLVFSGFVVLLLLLTVLLMYVLQRAVDNNRTEPSEDR